MDNTSNLSIGQFVISKAGRDKGKVFIVVEIIDDQILMVADGSLRRLEKPKKKKVKHLQSTNTVSDDIAQKISEGKKITNLMLRKEIEKLGF